VVIRVQHLAGPFQIHDVLGLHRPGQVYEPLQVGPDQVAVRRVLGQGGEAPQLPLGLGVRFFGELGGVDLLAQLVGLAGAGVRLPQLGLDLTHLASQHALAPARLDARRLALVAQAHLGLGDGELSLQVRGNALQPLTRVGLAQQGDALFEGQGQGGGDEVRQQAGVGQAGDEALPLVGQVLACVDHRVGQAHGAAVGGRELRAVVDRLRDRLDVDAQARLDGRDAGHARAHGAHHDRVSFQARRLDDARQPGNARHRMEVRQRGLVGGRIDLGGHHQQAVRARVFQRGKGARAPHGQRSCRHAWKYHDVSHGKHRENRGNLDLLLAHLHTPHVPACFGITHKGAG
jgi:hypothetical protein